MRHHQDKRDRSMIDDGEGIVHAAHLSKRYVALQTSSRLTYYTPRDLQLNLAKRKSFATTILYARVRPVSQGLTDVLESMVNSFTCSLFMCIAILSFVFYWLVCFALEKLFVVGESWLRCIVFYFS